LDLEDALDLGKVLQTEPQRGCTSQENTSFYERDQKALGSGVGEEGEKGCQVKKETALKKSREEG
jgi:hypothetical protein